MVEELPVVYIVDPSVAVTGALVAARNAARCLKNSARMVLVLPSTHHIPNEELRDFWRIETIPMVSLSKNLSAMLRYIPALILGAWQLHRHLRRDGATRLMLNDFYLMHGAVLRLLGFRGTIASWVRCNPSRFAGELAKPMLHLMNMSSTHVVAVSRYVQSLLPFPSHLLYDYYAGDARPPRSWREGNEKTFVYVGNYIRGKGQELALEAFALAALPDACLAFYGGDMGLAKNREYRAELERMAATLGIRARVTFGDFLNSPDTALETAYAALNFSTSESFSMTVLEASGTGVPVIATASGGPQEIIIDGVTGYLIPVGDIPAAADAIRRLANDPATTVTVGQAAAAHIQTHFSADRFRRQFADILLLPCP